MGFGRGKVILLGEHAVVHGCPAIAVGIERGVTAEAVTAERDLLRLSPWDLALGPDSNGDEPLERAFAAALAMYPSRPALEVSAQVDLPAGAGLGCSAGRHRRGPRRRPVADGARDGRARLGEDLSRQSVWNRQHDVGHRRRCALSQGR